MPSEIKTERLILREMTDACWMEYVARVTEADELFVQYGIEPDERLIEFIKEPKPEVLYRSIILKETGDMIGYIGVFEEANNLGQLNRRPWTAMKTKPSAAGFSSCGWIRF